MGEFDTGGNLNGLLAVEQLAVVLHKSPSSIRSDASRNPASLPPICRLPGSKRLLWRPEDVQGWLASFVETVYEMGWAPDLGGWVRGHHQVERPYWFPKLLLRDLRELQNDLDDLAQLKQVKDPGWAPDLRFQGGEN